MKHDSNEHKVIDSSLKSILSVTAPMVLTAMSSNFMFVIDRIMLAGYSIDSMNASIISANLVGIFTFMLIGIADSAEVFVGQYNGSKQYEKLAAPAWQMIYMSLASCVILWPMAYFSDYVNTLPHYYLKDGVEFQRILLYFAFLPPLKVAFAAFFIGQGKPKIVTFSIITGAIINVVLCYSFIYGIKNTIPSMGCKGAAIANVISEFISIVILAAVFFNCKNRKIYKTFKNCKFNKGLFFGCARIGVPVSFGNFISMIAWYIVQTLISHASKDAATIYNVGINVYIFFIFVGEGINKAVATICANMIGRGDLSSIEKTRKIFVAIAVFFGVVVSIPLIGFPQWIIQMLNILPDNLSALYSDIKIVLFIVAVNVVLETLMFSTWGILIAGGDSRHATITYQSCLWTTAIFPVIILHYLGKLTSVPFVYMFMGIWLLSTQFFLYKRYKSMKWYNKLV